MTVTGALELKFITLRKLKVFFCFFFSGQEGGGFGMEHFSFFFFPFALHRKKPIPLFYSSLVNFGSSLLWLPVFLGKKREKKASCASGESNCVGVCSGWW